MAELGNDDRHPDDRQDHVARRAYERWLARGGEHGGDMDDWLEAEREVHGSVQRGDAAPSESPTMDSAESTGTLEAAPNEPARATPKRRSRSRVSGDEAIG